MARSLRCVVLLTALLAAGLGVLGIVISQPLVARATAADSSSVPVSDPPQIRVELVDIGEARVTTRPGPEPEPTASRWPTTLTVGPTGDVASIAEAFELAGPGTLIHLGAGEHHGPMRTVRDGTGDEPIVITGPGRIIGDGDGRLVEIHHDHVWLVDVEIADADILVWIQGATGVRIVDSRLHGARSECVRLKYFATGNEITGNRISNCGRTDFDLDRGRKNGEGVYVGTAPEQLDRNPDDRPDRSDANWIHGNVFDVPAECVDIKEAAAANVVEDNVCTGGLDPDGAGFSSRGHATVFLGNTSTHHAGAGIRLGGDTETDGTQSIVETNVLTDNAGYGLKVLRSGQGSLCGNVLDRNGDGPAKNADHAADPCDVIRVTDARG